MFSLTSAVGFCLFAASAPFNAVQAFSSVPIRSRVVFSPAGRPTKIHSRLIRRMIEEDAAAAENSNVSVENEADSNAETAPPVEKKLDPEVVELKEKVSKLEFDIKRKKGELTDLKEMAEKYSQAGYMRQVALVENNKRRRGANMNDSKFAARATVIQSFIPVLDELDELHSKYEGNSFASTLGALRSGFKSSLQELGVTEYTAEIGDKIDLGRVVAVEEEHSEEFAAGSVISPLKLGLEIQGHVVRPAECVGSLGSSATEKEDQEDALSDEELGVKGEGNTE